MKHEEATQSMEQNQSDNPLRNFMLDFPSIEEQEAYWKQKDKNLDKTEATCQWIDEQNRKLPF